MDPDLSSNNQKTPAKLLEWLDYEYDHFEKSSDWFWIVGLAGLLIIIISIIFKNFLFAIIILIGMFTVMMFAVRQPELVHFQITTRGVKVKNEIFLFKDLHSFAIKDDQPPYKLSLESNRMFMPHIMIPLGDADPDQVRELMSRFLIEEPFEESIIDMIAEYLGF